MRRVPVTVVADVWGAVITPTLVVGVVIWLGAITGWPGWWISLMAITAAAAVAAVVSTRLRPGSRPMLAAAVGIAVVAASAGAVIAAAHTLDTDRSLVANRDHLRRISGDLICTILRTDTDADRAAALAAATGELAARLGSGAAALDSTAGASSISTTRCTPARTGVGAVTDDGADVIVAANITEKAGTDESASGRVVSAHLERVDGAWKVATLELIR